MNKIQIDSGAKIILVLILGCQLFFLNGIYLFAGLTCFYIGMHYLQLPYKPSVFTLIFIYHFLQIFAGVWQATYLGADINYRTNNMGSATMISYIGLLILFAPIMYFHNKIPNVTIEKLKIHANKLSLDRTYYAYLIAFFVSGALNGVRFLLPGYTQIIISLVSLKWFFFLIFGFQAVLKKRRKKELYFFIVLEFLLGFYSFFSEFKTVLFFVAAMYLTLLSTITTKRLVYGGIAAGMVFFLATIWTIIKVDYRAFLNQGSVSQNVAVSQNEALSKLYEITNTKGTKVSSSATEKFLDRLQGTYHLAKTMDMVPDIIPYQYGRNWGETFEFVFTPRLLNPDKPQLNSSEKASKYTGIRYAGREQGTAFSLGYFADCYIDFGTLGMFPALLIIGYLFGFSYFYFLRNSSSNYIFNYAIVCALFMRFFAFEMDSIFFIGGLVTDVLTYFLLSKFFFPWLFRSLSAPKETSV